eukprot:m.63378 g.63378  ORF g.63378 m.63378 type:complete len:285 (-) comp15833_c0_seq1:138-992(-)
MAYNYNNNGGPQPDHTGLQFYSGTTDDATADMSGGYSNAANSGGFNQGSYGGDQYSGGQPAPIMQPFSGQNTNDDYGFQAQQGFGGSMDTSGGFGGNTGGYGGGSSVGGQTNEYGEPPLLEELGIDFDQIKTKTLSVLHPLSPPQQGIMVETDLAGPLVFCLMFGSTMLASGRIQFGYIYAVAMLGSVGLYLILNLMSEKDISVGQVASVLGYCLLPMVILSAIGIVLPLNSTIGGLLSCAFVLWCAHSASKMFAAGLHMGAQQLLIAYPCLLLYGVFAMLTVF